MFSINEEIDFSDEDINLSILNVPNRLVKSTIETSPKHENKNSIKRIQTERAKNVSQIFNVSTSPKPTKRFRFTKTEQHKNKTDSERENLETFPKHNSDQHHLGSCIDVPKDFFDFDDQDDDLFSQLDLPKQNTATENTARNRSVLTTPIGINSKSSQNEENCLKRSIKNNLCDRKTVARKICPTSNNVTTPIPDKETVTRSPKELSCQKIFTPNLKKNVFQLKSARKDQKSPKTRGETPIRKFPGPAGNLPKLDNFEDLDNLRSPPFNKSKKSVTTPITPKTPLQELFQSNDQSLYIQLWTAMREFVDNKFSMQSLLSVGETLEKSSKRELENCKVPLLCGVVKSFSIVGNSGRLVLEDDTGEMNGAVHHDVLDEYQQGLGKGSGLILKDVSVFSPSVKRHYLNITPTNIAALFERDLEEPLTQFTQVENNSTIILDSGS